MSCQATTVKECGIPGCVNHNLETGLWINSVLRWFDRGNTTIEQIAKDLGVDELEVMWQLRKHGRIPTHGFRRKIEALLEEERCKSTGTPDFILAAYLQKCLDRFPQEGVSGNEVHENWKRIFGEDPSKG